MRFFSALSLEKNAPSVGLSDVLGMSAVSLKKTNGSSNRRKPTVKNFKLKVAFGCYFLAGLLLIGFGVVYLFRQEFMPYHSVAVGLTWADVPPSLQILMLALMKAVGGTTIAVAVAVYIVLLVPFREGARWALWAVPTLGLVESAAAFYPMSYVALNTTASPPLWAPATGVLLNVVALVLSLSASKKTGV